MTRIVPTLAALALAALSIDAIAQDFHSPSIHGQRHHHDDWHHDHRAPDVARLDHYADQLAKITRHLHADAHQLSQDYEHSDAVEHYVDNVERLQQHLHEVLHDSADSGHQSLGLAQHIKSDVRQVKSLLERLYGELQHQGFDGARSGDFQAMRHMRQIISRDAFPLVRKMERELYGYPQDHHRIQTYRRRISPRNVIRPWIRS